MSEKSESVWSKLQRIDRRILYWILFVGLMVPFIRPIGLPIVVTPSTRDLYEGLRQVEEGDVVVLSISSGVSAWPECLPGMVAAVKILVQQKAKIIGWTTFVDGPITWDKIVSEVPGLKEYTYGEDYVWFGYFAGGETAVAQLARDIRSVFTADYYGTPIDELPIMENVNDVHDIRLVLSSDTGDVCDYYIRQWNTPYGTPVAEIGIAMLGSSYMPFYKAGILFGMSVGVRGGAELEKLINEPGDATIRMDAINMSHVLVVIAVILANVGYFATRRER